MRVSVTRATDPKYAPFVSPAFDFKEYLADLKEKASRPPFEVRVNGLTVTVKTGRKQKKNILDDVSFYLKPGTMTLVLGAPGCGKSVLFQALAAQLKIGKQSGNITFNGKPPNPKTHHRDVALVDQEDIHFPTLTVRETLEFALRCQAPEFMPLESKRERVDLILKMLDLKHVENTLVGNDLIRGVSGGQRKRVTIGVSVTKDPRLILLDEPTTGLDANTSLEVLTAARHMCNVFKNPIAAALLQPSPEICALFDNLIILSKGKVAYFGPYNNAVPYLERYGLVAGMFQSDPEFIQEAIEFADKYTKPETRAYTRDDMIDLFRQSSEYQELQQILAQPPDEMEGAEVDNVIYPTYPTSYLYQTRLNFERCVKMLRRNKATLIDRIAQKAVLAAITGSLFFNLPYHQSGLNTRLSLLFFAILFLAFGNVGSIVSFYQERKVFYSQREHKYYHPAAYFIAQTIMEIPIILVECVIFGSIMYWMCGLNPDPERFLYFLLMLIVSNFFSINSCRAASSLIATEQSAAGLVPAIYAIFVLYSGYIIAPKDIPVYWNWLYRISPFTYSLEGLMINELVGTTYDCSSSETYPPAQYPLFNVSYPDGFSGSSVCPTTQGVQRLDFLGMHTDVTWRWYHVIIVLCYGAFCMCITLYGFSRVYHPSRIINNRVKGAKDKSKKKKGVSIEVQPRSPVPKVSGAYMSWENLKYSVDVKKKRKVTRLTLLDGVSGFVKPGMLLALMGPSGAGKSTLLDVLAKRKTGGHIEGTVLINGQPQDRFFTRLSGYVEQNDMLMPYTTVKEAIMFSAQNRLSHKLTQQQKEDKVMEVLRILDLDGIQNLFAINLSLEQRKRLTIGVELIADPVLLFLDEPTSGLDSKAAAKVMDVVQRVASTGRSVICTIHQPSAHIFTYFDHLLLLKKGGSTVYFGPTGKECEEMFGYFSEIGWECPRKRNPADFILDVASATSAPIAGSSRSIHTKGKEPEHESVAAYNPAELFANSELRRRMNEQMRERIEIGDGHHFHGIYPSDFFTQLRANVSRSWKNATRKKAEVIGRFARNFIQAVIMGTLYLQLDTDQTGAGARFSVMFFAIFTAGSAGNAAIPAIIEERPVFYREKASGTYRTITYLVGLVLTELPLNFLGTLFLSVPLYWMVGLRAGASYFFFFCWVVFIYSVLAILLSFFLAMVLKNGEMAQAMNGNLVSLYALFAGFLIYKPDIPVYWIWMFYLSLMHYPLEALVVNEVKDLPFSCPGGKGAVNVPISFNDTLVFKEYCPIFSGNVLLNTVGMELDFKYADMGIVLGFIGVVFALCYIALRYVKHINR